MRLLTLSLFGVGHIAAENVQIGSQPAIAILPPAGGQAVPLLVHLHSWSSRFDNSATLADVRAEAKHVAGRSFRRTSKASTIIRGLRIRTGCPGCCSTRWSGRSSARRSIRGGSNLVAAVRAAGYMGAHDGGPDAGVSGRRVSAIVPNPPTLSALVCVSKEKGLAVLEDARGKLRLSPTHGMALQQYRAAAHTPIHFFAAVAPRVFAVDNPDGNSGWAYRAVPVSHTLRAFNELAAPGDRIPGGRTSNPSRRRAKVPSAMAANVDEPGRRK
jgi:hypothetical protein